jgi:hypothetical protein
MSPRLIIVRSVETGTPMAADTSFKRKARRSFFEMELMTLDSLSGIQKKSTTLKYIQIID